MSPISRILPMAAACGPARARALRALVAGVTVLAAAAACRNAATSPGDALGISGTYQLVQVNAAPLPYQDGNTFVLRGSLTIYGTPRYDLAEVDSAAGATTTFRSSGQWNITSNAIVLKDSGGDDYFGSLSGNKDTVRVQVGTHLGTYVRQ